MSTTERVKFHAAPGIEVTLIRRQAPHPVYSNGRSWMSGTWKSYESATRFYVGPAGESVLANLVYRASRPVKVYRKAATAALEAMNLTDRKLEWSRTAGCSCGCSPGFILIGSDGRRETWTPDGGSVDVFIDISDEAATLVGVEDEAGLAVDPAKVDIAAFRAAQISADSTLAPFLGGAL